MTNTGMKYTYLTLLMLMAMLGVCESTVEVGQKNLNGTRLNRCQRLTVTMKPINFSLAPHWRYFDSGLSDSWCKRKIKAINGLYGPTISKFSINNDESNGSEKVFLHLKDFLRPQGFVPRKSTNLYYSYDFSIITGSVSTHIDNNYGLVAGVLLFATASKIDNSYIELVTSHGGLALSAGDVFVFNADKWHGWISNVTCLLALMTVKKVRSKNTTQVKTLQL